MVFVAHFGGCFDINGTPYGKGLFSRSIAGALDCFFRLFITNCSLHMVLTLGLVYAAFRDPTTLRL